MRKWWVAFIVVLGCLGFAGQATASVAAAYSDCCLQGCKGMASCASASCQACAAPQPAPPAGQPLLPGREAPAWPAADAPFDAGPCREPWKPPDRVDVCRAICINFERTS